jgi:DNA-binding transcriptional LysR family regulator
VRFEPLTSDEVILVALPDHPLAGGSVSLEGLRGQQLILMQEGAGVRQVVEDELRRAGMRLRDLDIRLELGLQESVRAAVLAGFGVTFISRTAVVDDLASGRLAEVRVEGMDVKREISLARAAGRPPSRTAEAFVAFARARLAP